MLKKRKTTRFLKRHPVRYLVMGYFIVTLSFTFLLMLPISSAKRETTPFVDALFTAASGISTTGLIVVDTGTHFSLFGQIVLMIDFQIGGLGYMAFFVLVAYIFRKKLLVTTRVMANESVAGSNGSSATDFFLKVILFTLFFELGGGIILFLYWLPHFPPTHAFYLGIFHSISAFCTAGFCLFQDSLMSYKNSSTINLVIIFVSLAGGIGFYVLNELYLMCKRFIKREKYKRLSIHSKLALIMTAILLLIGTATIFASEKWSPQSTIRERLMDSSFQAISASTTDGYNSIDIGAMTSTSLFMIMLLMFVGASPGSTGGGIKTTTLGVIFLTTWSNLRKKSDTSFSGRGISTDIKEKAMIVFFLFVSVAVVDMLILTVTEKASFLQVLFETVSALGNTGLSTGITASLTTIAKIILSITMFVGRVGPLTIGLALVSNSNPPDIRYPVEEVYVG